MFDQKKFDRDFRIMDIMFKIMFPLVLFLILSVFALQIYVGVKAVQAVDEHGLKAVVERVWEGPNGTVR
jgi:hypothetical protein